MLRTAFLLAIFSVGANAALVPIIPSQLQDAVNATLRSFQRLIDVGAVVAPAGWNESVNTPIPVNIPGLVLNVGLVTLPFPFLCNETDPIVQRLVCRLASIDCTYVHKTYGGKCGYSPNPVPGTTQEYGQIFLCNDQKPTNYTFTNISDPAQCDQLLGPLLDPVLDLALAQVIRARFMTDLCQGSYPNLSSVGCDTDCRNNHQYVSGYCLTGQTPTATFVGETFPDFQCVCSYAPNNN